MDKILVLYKSKYGATKKYANMLKEELGCEILKIEDWNPSLSDDYDSIVFAGAVYASGIGGIDILRKNYDKLKNKKTAVFCVGASPYDEKAIADVKEHNMKGELKNVPLFYGRGAWDEKAMNFKDRMLCKMLQKAIGKKDPANYEPWMAALMEAAGQKCDWTDRSYLVPLIEYLQQ
ncbi:MAG: flavodoxin domain-containing protein [Ruminococcus sp.]|jgi:menaquinone-dependent protoporphyrinogen IX oxidase